MNLSTGPKGVRWFTRAEHPVMGNHETSPSICFWQLRVKQNNEIKLSVIQKEFASAFTPHPKPFL